MRRGCLKTARASCEAVDLTQAMLQTTQFKLLWLIANEMEAAHGHTQDTGHD